MAYLWSDPRGLRYLTEPVTFVTNFSRAGTDFLLGKFLEDHPTFIVTFLGQIAPMIIWLSALVSVLIHAQILPRAIDASGRLCNAIFGPGLSARTACVAVAAPFLGQTVAPLCIRSSLHSLTRSELMTIMTCGFASMSAVMIGVYGSMLDDAVREVTGNRALPYLVSASLMSIPAAILVSKILVPERHDPPDFSVTADALQGRESNNFLSALALGAGEGVRLVVGIAATVLAFTSLLALCRAAANQAWAQTVLLWGFSVSDAWQLPFELVAWFLGVTQRDVTEAAALLRTQLISTEYVAFEGLKRNLESPEPLVPLTFRSTIVMMYAIASFANLPSIAIQMSFLSTVAPERRVEIANLAPKAMIAGVLASWMTASVVGTVFDDRSLLANRDGRNTVTSFSGDRAAPAVPGTETTVNRRSSSIQGLWL